MSSSATLGALAPEITGSVAGRDRAWLVALSAACAAGAAMVGWRFGIAADVEADLARLLRFMALLKGAFAAVALLAAWWRLGRPSAGWRRLSYLAGPGLMAGGAILLWQLHAAGLATIVLHAGMFALLAAALTDRDFIPALARSRRMKAGALR